MLFVFVIPALLLLAFFAYVRPQAATILLTALIPSYLIRFSVIGIPTNFFEISIFIVFSFLFVQKKVRGQWLIALKQMPRWIIFFIGLFVLSAIISTFASPHLRTSLGVLKGWVFAPLLIGWLVYAFGCVGTKDDWYSSVLSSLVGSGVAVSLVGLTQIYQLDRVRSIYDVSNSLALYITPLLVIAFFFSMVGYKKPFYLPATIIMASALIATKSVSGIVATMVTMIIGVFVYYFAEQLQGKRKTYIVGLIFVIFFVVSSFFVVITSGRLNYLMQPWGALGVHNSISVRMQLWDISFELIREHPFLGAGLGTFEPAYQEKLHNRFSQFNSCDGECINKPLPEFVYRDPHSWPLSFWLNVGVLGFLSFSLINAVIMWSVVVRQNLRLVGARSVFVVAVLLALIAVLLFGLTDTIYWKNDLASLYWILLALLVGLQVRAREGVF
jgi:O-antigen ligase